MQKGLNSDLTVRGKKYHVQTEDWGRENPFLVSRVFRDGAVIKTIKTSHTEALKKGPIKDVEALQIAMKDQHHRVLDQVFAGEFHQ